MTVEVSLTDVISSRQGLKPSKQTRLIKYEPGGSSVRFPKYVFHSQYAGYVLLIPCFLALAPGARRVV